MKNALYDYYYFNRGDSFGGVTPDKVSGLQLWLDANDSTTITLASTEVVDWADKSTNGYNFSQDTVANQPTYNSLPINGKKTVTFNGTTDYMVSDETGIINPGASDFTCYLVFRSLMATTETPLSQQDGTGTGRSWIRTENVGSNLESFLGGTQFDLSTYSADQLVVGVLENDTSAGNLKFFLNGGTATFDGAKTIEAATGALVLGSVKVVNAQFLNGELCEMVLYNNILSLPDFNGLGSYLGSKWGATWTPRTS